MKRKNIFVIVAGTNHSGKTLSITKIIDRYPGKVLAINPTNEKKFFGFRESYGSFGGLKVIKPKLQKIIYDESEIEAFVFPDLLQKKDSKFRYQAIPKYEFGKSYESSVLPALEAVFYSYRNGLLVLDDCSAMMKGRLSAAVESIFVARRQMNLDIIAVFHSLGKIPPAIIPYITGIIIHKVIESSNTYAYKIPEEILKAKERVQLQTQSNPYYSEYVKL